LSVRATVGIRFLNSSSRQFSEIREISRRLIRFSIDLDQTVTVANKNGFREIGRRLVGIRNIGDER
jgi:hypothetical protein